MQLFAIPWKSQLVCFSVARRWSQYGSPAMMATWWFTRYSEKTNGFVCFVCFQNVASTLCSSECHLAFIYYSKIHSKSKWITATVFESKPRKLCGCRLISFSFAIRLFIILTIVWHENFQKSLIFQPIKTPIKRHMERKHAVLYKECW